MGSSTEDMMHWRIGDVTVTRIVESTFEGLEAFLPDATPEVVLKYDWLRPFLTDEGVLKFSIHALVIETPSRRIIVDTCVGNEKPREVFPIWHMLQTGFLDDLAKAGFPPETFDTVLCTHLHLDHVGWNTMLVGGEWVPTFPNARYLIERSEFAFLDTEGADDGQDQWARDMNAAVMADPVRPVVAAGLVDLVSADHVVCDEVRLVPTPGHTPGHVSIRIDSRGESALITGDFIHHPCQLAHPEWSLTSDFDPTQSAQTREGVFSGLAGTPTLVIGTHWPDPTAGRIARDAGAFRLDI